MKIILPIILSLFLLGCAHDKEVIIPDNQVVNIDSSMLEYCPYLSESVIISTFEDVLISYADISKKYGECAAKQADSVKLLKQFSNK